MIRSDTYFNKSNKTPQSPTNADTVAETNNGCVIYEQRTVTNEHIQEIMSLKQFSNED